MEDVFLQRPHKSKGLAVIAVTQLAMPEQTCSCVRPGSSENRSAFAFGPSLFALVQDMPL
jgi:hypothetical protein